MRPLGPMPPALFGKFFRWEHLRGEEVGGFSSFGGFAIPSAREADTLLRSSTPSSSERPKVRFYHSEVNHRPKCYSLAAAPSEPVFSAPDAHETHAFHACPSVRAMLNRRRRHERARRCEIRKALRSHLLLSHIHWCMLVSRHREVVRSISTCPPFLEPSSSLWGKFLLSSSRRTSK